jgi:hypothetical protein
MKITDDYRAKIRLWVLNPQVAPAPLPPSLPKFSSKKFSSHAEMNRWKQELLKQLAREGAENG